jgi:heme exporter protein C
MKFLKKILSPKFCYDFLSTLLPWVACSSAVLIVYGLIGGLILAPADYQQGDGFRIIYVHVPAAFLSIMVYASMTFSALISLVWRIKVADFAVSAAAPIGFSFTLIALITGSFWGKPMWGTWWIWDARLTSELILLFIYIAIIALTHALQGAPSQSLLRNIFVLIGAINLPIIHYSVYWWNSLHQGATLSLSGPSHIAPAMLRPLLSMILGFICLFLLIWFMRLRNLILSHSHKNQRIG